MYQFGAIERALFTLCVCWCVYDFYLADIVGLGGMCQSFVDETRASRSRKARTSK